MNRTQAFAFRLVAAAFALAVFNSTIVGVKAQTPAAPAAKPAPPADEEEPSTPQPPPPLPPGMTGSTMNDPRVGLKPGLYDAGEAAMGMEHLAFLKKADAFQLPATQPDDPVVQKTLDTLGVNKAKLSKPMQLVIAQLAFSNSDFAFQGTHLFQGNFYGVNFYDISNPAKISLLTSLVCPGGQGDVSVYKNLLFMSVEMPNGRLDCGTQGFPPMPPPEPGHEKDQRVPAASPDRFRGVRIFDISDIKNPKQVAAVQTCRGSHTHTLVVDPNDKDNVYLYVSGTSFVRPAAELAGCSDEAPDKDPNTSLFRIDVIKVPVAAPEQAKVVSSPRVFIDARSGALNGLNNGGSHGKGAEKPTDTNQCHDITVYSAIGLAAGACSGNGLLLDIRDPVHPKRVDAVNDPNYSYWHSASFSNDGTKVVFTDEWGGGLQPRCRATDPNKWGADAIFNLKDDKLSLASYYKMPAAQTETENCVAHNGSLVPIPGRDIEVQAWYQGGISVVDFTDASASLRDCLFRSRTHRCQDIYSGRRLVGVLVQRLYLWVGNRAWARRLQAGAQQISYAERDRCGQPGPIGRAQRAKSTKNYMAVPARCGAGLSGSVRALAGAAREANRRSQQGDCPCAGIASGQEGRGKVAWHGSFCGDGGIQCQEHYGRQPPARAGADTSESGSVTVGKTKGWRRYGPQAGPFPVFGTIIGCCPRATSDEFI